MNRVTCAIALVVSVWLGLGLSSPVEAKSVAKEFSEAWTARQSRLETERDATRAELGPASEKLVTMLRTESELNGEEVVKSLTAIFLIAKRHGYSAGRALALQRLRAFMNQKPSPVRAQLWLEEEVEMVKSAAVSANSALEASKTANAEQTSEGFYKRVQNTASVLSQLAATQGAAEELANIDGNLALYFKAKHVEDDNRRAKRAAILGALAAAAQNAQNSANSGWSATCTRMGSFTHCSGD